MWRERDRTLRLLILWGLVAGVQQQVQQQQSGQINQNLGLPEAGTLFTGTGTNLYYGVNLVPFGPEVGDQEVIPGMLTSGQTIDLHMYFPFYGGLYNYTTISVNGYIGFAVVLDQGPTINIGPDATDWPKHQDPAMIAPYLCKQQIPQDMNPGMRSGVFFRLMMRQSLFGRGSGSNMNLGGSYQSSFFGQSASQACQGTHGGYVRCDQNSDYFLDEMMRWLQEGVAGAAAFRADAALVVTWYNTASAISGRSDMDAGQLSTYQLVWLTDEAARLSYVILNYDKLGFDAADFRANSRSGRCQAVFNGGNHTGLVPVDPTQAFKNTPKVLSQRSGVPHMVRGRYMFRVDDVVRPAGCSNKTGGTYPMLIYPNIVNMMGEMTVDVNAICLDRAQTYILMIEQRQTATCTVLNPSIARCHLPKIYDWGTKTVYFQPQSGGANDEKAFVGYIYFVPPTLDPMRLDIGNIYDWFKNPIPYQVMPLTWYPRNFTNPDIATHMESVRISDDTMYSVQLGLYVIGYREFKDDDIKKFRPEHRVLCRLATYSNRNTYEYRWKPQEERINIYQVEQWYLNDWQRTHELYNYRFGYLKLAPIKPNQLENQPQTLLSGLVSAPISLHWLWTTNNPEFSTTTYSQNDENARVEFVKKKSLEMCHDWYNEDGAQWNFIRDTETNSSCPCIEKQAMADLGRFMPHPRCSQAFRDITCTVAIGARNCYMSAQNIYGSYAGTGRGFESENTARFPTHYGQVCCYDDAGHLMQTSYQPVIKVTPEVPYNPGFPMRAYEFGTSPYMGQYNEDGAQWNFIRDTETNSSCPCIEKQAMADLGRFMPHPRCSQAFRDITCTVAIGARNCYMSAQNIYGSYAGTGRGFESENTARFPTHYGQVCCYDDAGHLMQTSYQPVIKVTPEVPYNPGFPMRAYEFGTSPYMGQYEVPGLSAFHNDYMPYFLCCKFADFRCQMFYWRRPSSGCQEYQPPAYGEGMGAGTFNTIDNDKFIFNEPGVFNVLYIPQTTTTPEVKVQLRLERYPDRRVDFSEFSLAVENI
ncbi:AMOP domain protein [Ancylostoma duodenale]|uniref:AMOP domain protein n=1 Tax=Ancylostoma duodenale TaxID=51022 RepID=A0A0C2GZF4_9BILA|nr:AMOP domain protein [Ancylostoma duodenale]